MDYYKHSSKNKLIKIWYGMKSRCYNQHNKDYRLYGGKGITICDEWLVYDNFVDWALSHGYIEGLSIDRIDPKLGYQPTNCEWVTPAENSRRRTVTSPTSYSPNEEQRAKLSITSKMAHINDPTLKERQKHLRDTNGRTKISVDDIEKLRQAKLCGESWKYGLSLLTEEVNIRYFRYAVWNKL